MGWLIGLTIILLLPGAVAIAQSGRKAKKADPQPPVQGVNQPEARTVPEPEAPPEKPKVAGPGVVIASDVVDLDTPIFFVSIARQACAAEMRDARFNGDIREAVDKNRVDAIKIAKDDNVYVVHLELRNNVYAPRTSSYSRYNFELRYTLFEPKTGKILNSGPGYPSQGRMGRSGPIGYDYDQRQVELMGRDVGQRVLKYVNGLPRPLALARSGR
jgi:hypothetical protein